MRPQAIVVIFVVLVLLSRGEAKFVSDAPDANAEEELAAVPTATFDPVPATVTPSPTPSPTPLAPSNTPTPPPTIAPTPVPAPVATERPVPPPSTDTEMSEVVTQPDTGRREIALTFDAGDGRGNTVEILDLLDQFGAVGTFGVTGAWAEANPDLVRAMADRGHQIINHGFSHDSLTGDSTDGEPMTDDEIRAELRDTEEAIRAATGGYEVAPYLRPPYGDYDANVLRLLEELGYDYTIWWGCDSKAWMGHTADDIVRECGTEQVAPGLIVLLHVDTDPDVEALPQLLETYTAAGYDLVSVEQLMQP